MTPNNNGVIVYTALGGEPVRGYPHYPYNGFTSPPVGPTYTAGDQVVLYLDYGYTHLDKSVKDFSHTNLTVGGQSETLYFGSVTTYHLQFDAISDVRGIGMTEEIAAFEAMQLAGISGQLLTWYPEWTGSGNDVSYQCALRKRVPPTRMGSDIHMWTMLIDLEVLPTMTIPAVPAFV